MSGVSRSWCFTLNNYQPQELQALRVSPLVSFLIMGKEVGASGTPHIQGYITLTKPSRLKAMKALNARAHWEVARCREASITYCKKDRDFEIVDNRKPSRIRRHPTSQSREPPPIPLMPTINFFS